MKAYIEIDGLVLYEELKYKLHEGALNEQEHDMCPFSCTCMYGISSIVTFISKFNLKIDFKILFLFMCYILIN